LHKDLQKVAKKQQVEHRISLPEVLVIHSTEKIYRLAWALGNLLEIPLEWADDFQITNNKNETSTHDCLRCDIPDLETDVKLLANKGSNYLLISSRPPADFLFILKGVNAGNLINEWLPLLKKKPYWSLCYHLDDSKRQSLLPVLYL